MKKGGSFLLEPVVGNIFTRERLTEEQREIDRMAREFAREKILPHKEELATLNKELSLQFALGYSPEEFAATLQHIAEGRLPVEPLITGKVGVEGVPGAFDELASPERHAKILVEPWRSRLCSWRAQRADHSCSGRSDFSRPRPLRVSM